MAPNAEKSQLKRPRVSYILFPIPNIHSAGALRDPLLFNVLHPHLDFSP